MTYYRIGRWYSNLDELTSRRLHMLVGVVGSFHCRAQASDHLLVSLLVSRRIPHRRSARRIPASIANKPIFVDILARKCEDLALTRSPARRLSSLTELAHCAARLTAKTLVANGDSTPCLLADAALRAYACLRHGRRTAA